MMRDAPPQPEEEPPALLARPLRVLQSLWQATMSDRIYVVAAGCAFYGLMALFPAMSLLISGYGLIFDPWTVEPQLQALIGIVPEATYALIEQHVRRLVEAPRPQLEWGAALSLGLVFWSATAGTRALMSALNLAHDAIDRRGVIAFYGIGLLLTLGAIVTVALAIALLVALPLVLDLFEFVGGRTRLLHLSAQGILLILIQLWLSVLYRYGPWRPGAPFRLVTPGSLLATTLWAGASVGFTSYVRQFAAYDSMYGPLGTPVVLLLWFYIAGFAILLGAELDVALERTRLPAPGGAAIEMDEPVASVQPDAPGLPIGRDAGEVHGIPPR